MADIQFILEKTGPGNSTADFKLFACRGAGRGCPRNKYRSRKKHCEDCLPADNENETLEAFRARLLRGDA